MRAVHYVPHRRYLAPVVEECWPDRLWVDCEYSRVADPAQEKILKQVTRADGPDEKRSVFPDLVIHDRRGSSQDHDHLIVEAKKDPVGSREVKHDLQKLKAYQRELGYQYAVYLERRSQHQWRWMDRRRYSPAGRPPP